ncbi:PorT family protein [Litoribacter ruber]|uniref:PorT family protein n=1 Tax=Litoribacter ruber TaxID=702568 RepID=A0AAP2G0U1_9BACT|nr:MULTISPECIES: porin family protein [Litoribacter]MBS9522922.1 PorT family protein [Litoribacter alkaliphilus]MBT0810931.1 PorT family protein [Litoribacter ruber]
MKKLILGVLAAVSLSFSANAQMRTPAADQVATVGIRGGANFFNWGGSDASNNGYTNRTGFHAGLYGNMFVTDRFSIEPGAYYSVKGTQNDGFANSRAVLDYIDVPILLRFYATDGLNFFAGPQGSILLRSRFEGDLFGNTFVWDTNNVNSLDAGLVFGLGYNLPMGLNLQGSYDLGLTPVFQDSNAEIYNRGFKVSLGYSF